MRRALAIGAACSGVALALLFWLTRGAVELDAGGDHYALAEPRALCWLGLLPLVLAAGARSLADLPPAQMALSATVRALVVSALAIALAQPARTTDRTETAVVYLVDVSSSIPDGALERVTRRLREALAAHGDDVFVVTFAAEARRVAFDPDDPESLTLARHEDGAATDLAGALRLGLALLPDGRLGRIVVFSDGSETEPGALGQLGALAQRGVHVYGALGTEGPPADLAIEDVALPAHVQVGESFPVRVRLRATREQHARLRLYQNDLLNGLEGTREIDLPRGSTEVELRSIVHVAGPITYRATLTPSDPALDRFPENDVLERAIVVPGRPRVLYVEGEQVGTLPLTQALETAELDVELRSPRAFPTSISELGAFDFVILSDTSADAISPEQQALIERYVQREGGGFLMAGGPHAFGLGDWGGTRIERILPVRMDPDRRRDQPALALALVIDRSGSMNGDKIELAKEAARATADLLSADDSLGVIGFDSVPERIVRMQSAGNRVAIQRDIGRLAPRGGTAIFPALDMALSDLSVTRARLRHVILLTDGQTQESGIGDLVSLMRGEGITISTVGIGSDVNRALLQEIADQGGGRAYFTSDAHNIPRIFTHETTTAMQNGAVEDYVAAHVVVPAAFLRGVPIESAPLLRGYVATRMRSAPAEEILQSDLGEPLLARMHVGLGWTLAWTSDVKNRWALDWARWPAFSSFFGGLVREHMRQRHDEELPLEASMIGEQVRIVVDALDANDAFVNDLDPIAHVVGPMGAPEAERRTLDVPLLQVAPGRYEGQARLDRFGAYAITAEHRRGGDVVAQSVGSVVYPYAPEYAALEPNGDLLQALATASGGAAYEGPAQVLDAAGEHVRARQDVRAPFFLAALALFVVDLLLRRVRLFDRGFRSRPDMGPRPRP